MYEDFFRACGFSRASARMISASLEEERDFQPEWSDAYERRNSDRQIQTTEIAMRRARKKVEGFV